MNFILIQFVLSVLLFSSKVILCNPLVSNSPASSTYEFKHHNAPKGNNNIYLYCIINFKQLMHLDVNINQRNHDHFRFIE